MRRALTVSAIVLPLFLAMAVPAAHAASRPTIVTSPKGDLDLGNLNDGPAGDVCPFPVDAAIHFLGMGHVIMFNGQPVGFAGMSFGAIKAEVTNLDTGATATVNISGPGGLTGDGLPLLGRGPWVTFEPIDQGGIHYTRGRTSFEPASYGVHATLISGIEEDLCDRVA
jgi:hypothetical protein